MKNLQCIEVRRALKLLISSWSLQLFLAESYGSAEKSLISTIIVNTITDHIQGNHESLDFQNES
jgi:hypothetical protein